MNQTWKKKKILILGPILPNNWVLIFFAGFISTSNYTLFQDIIVWPDFGPFYALNFFFWILPLMLNIAASYYYMQFQGKLINKKN